MLALACTARRHSLHSFYAHAHSLRRCLAATSLSAVPPAAHEPSPPISGLRALPVVKPLYVDLLEPLNPNSEKSLVDHVVSLDPTVFGHPMRRDILHLCVVQYRDSLRQGSANTKTRGEVKGSGRKLYAQKGSGRARVGDAQSPIRRGGGVVFGPKPRDFSTKLPRKVIQMGMRVALSAKLKDQRLGIMSHLDWENGKTQTLAQRLQTLALSNALFVSGEDALPLLLERSIRNIEKVSLVHAPNLTVYDTMIWERLILDLKAVEFFEKMLGKSISFAGEDKSPL